MVAAGRATHPFNRRWSVWRWRRWSRSRRSRAPYTAERVGLLTMLCLVVTFGIHSFVDWTWYVPGLACVALLCAGWLAGRGPLTASLCRRADAAPAGSRHRAGRSRRHAYARIAVAVVVAALLAAWAEWQPQRSVEASNQALALVKDDPTGALAQAHAAVSRDPLSAEALITLAAVQQGTGQGAAAQRDVRASRARAALQLADLGGAGRIRAAGRRLAALR